MHYETQVKVEGVAFFNDIMWVEEGELLYFAASARTHYIMDCGESIYIYWRRTMYSIWWCHTIT